MSFLFKYIYCYFPNIEKLIKIKTTQGDFIFKFFAANLLHKFLIIKPAFIKTRMSACYTHKGNLNTDCIQVTLNKNWRNRCVPYLSLILRISWNLVKRRYRSRNMLYMRRILVLSLSVHPGGSTLDSLRSQYIVIIIFLYWLILSYLYKNGRGCQNAHLLHRFIIASLSVYWLYTVNVTVFRTIM